MSSVVVGSNGWSSVPEKGAAERSGPRQAPAREDPAIARLLAHPLFRRVGGTPLVRLARIPPKGLAVFAKLESANPSGSVKDRAGRAIVEAALRAGHLPGKRLLDSSSGNTAISYAMFGAAVGFGVTICLPGSASPERKRILRAYGAEIVETDPLEGSDGAILAARELFASSPDTYWFADQYGNPANPAAHETGTGPEILRQHRKHWREAGRPAVPLDLFVAGLGTSGTYVGVSRYLQRESPATRRVSVQPDSPFHGLEGLKHMPTAIVPRIFDPRLVDVAATVGTEEGQEMTRRLAREEGLLTGVSTGAALAASLRAARETGAATAVFVLCDQGDRYLTERFWEAR